MKPITTALAAVLAVITLGIPVNAAPTIADFTEQTNLQATKSSTISQYLKQIDLTPVTVCIQLDDDCIDIGSGAIHNKSKTLLTAKHLLLGEGWFTINGLRISSNRAVFKVKSNGRIIQSLSYNQAALPCCNVFQRIST
jgi:hypothetical protein